MLTPTNLFADRTIFNVICTLEKGGVFGELKKHSGGITIKNLAQHLALNEPILEALFEFLVVNAPEVLIKKNKKYYITSTFLETAWQNCLYFTLAYEPVFTELLPILKGEMEYGKDVVRVGSYLRISSAIHNEPAWDLVIDRIKRMEISTIVDCGSSGGDFLLRACSEIPDVHGIGIENDALVVTEANDRLKNHVLSNRVTIVEGDASQPEIWRKNVLRDIESTNIVFTGITLWHEFLYYGEQYFLDILKRFRDNFPGSIFIVVEYNGFEWENLKMLSDSFREAASVYQLVHPLTNQGMPLPQEKWLEIFKKANIRLQEVETVKPNSTVYIGVL